MSHSGGSDLDREKNWTDVAHFLQVKNAFGH
jgi:hypothetical protein